MGLSAPPSAHVSGRLGSCTGPFGPYVSLRVYVPPAFTDVIGKTPRLLQGPETELWILQAMWRPLEEDRPFEGEAINYRKDGTPYVHHWSTAPVRNDNGTITHWVSVQRDVTEERRMAERLRKVQGEERHCIAQKMHDELGASLRPFRWSSTGPRPRSTR